MKETRDLINVELVLPEKLLILPVLVRPVFPNIMVPITFSGEKFLSTIKKAADSSKKLLGLVLIEEENELDLFNSKLYSAGTTVKILRVIQLTSDTVQVMVQGLNRFKHVSTSETDPYLEWQVDYHVPSLSDLSSDEIKAYLLAIMASLKELFKINPLYQEELKLLMSQVSYEKPEILVDLISSMLKTDNKDLQDLLEEFNLENRCKKLLTLLKKELEISHIQEKIQRQIEEKVSKQQKEFFLREQLKFIKKELGLEKDDKGSEIEEIQQKASSLKLTKEAKTVIKEQMDKMKVLDISSPEYHVIRSYLHTIVSLPWGKYSKEVTNIKNSREILDRDHYGLEDVKNNILEFIGTVMKTGNVNGSILCLIGPPGVGKTSIGKSVAKALNRKFYRFSVGGMKDEAEIKGHRRTYIGAIPGKIIEALKRTETSNPVIMLDEIDKIGSSFRGDPASALLEVLDPEQNKEFLDHYLDIRFDLSKILFVTTANQIDTIPRPLLDRMEVIHLAGYIKDEKYEIAKRYLIPNQMKYHGLTKDEINFTKSAINEVIEKYAREAGVRNLEKSIRKIMRKVTLKLVENKESEKIKITLKNLEEFLGKPIFQTEDLYKKEIPGVTLGLAWTSMGGATLYIEAASISEKGIGFKQTGQLGGVMKESSEIAYSYVRSILSKKKNDYFDKNYIHLHVPAGAVPKDGPSAGITMALALYSAAINKPVKKDLAMTGELTLTGKVLPIGGLKEKCIAAKRVKISNLIVPLANKKDFERLPDYIREGLNVQFADYFKDVIKYAF